jgi:hypothetical protein
MATVHHGLPPDLFTFASGPVPIAPFWGEYRRKNAPIARSALSDVPAFH